MNEFFASVKADLTDRRLLPAVAVVCALLVAAIAYAVLGGGSSSSTSSLPPVPSVKAPTGIAVTQAPTQKAVAETTDGASAQTHGVARDPFAPLPGSETTTTPTAGTPASGGSSGSSSTASTSTGSGSETSSGSGGSSSNETSGSSNGGQSKPKAKPKTIYDVTIKFGVLPPGTAPEAATLTEYKKLKLQTPAAVGRPAADRLPRRDRERPERDVHARERSDPDRRRRVPAEPAAVPGRRPQAR